MSSSLSLQFDILRMVGTLIQGFGENCADFPNLEHPPPTPETPKGPRLHIPGNAVIRSTYSINEYLIEDLTVRKLNDIHAHLWWAGRPGNIRPLHRQKMMHREIIITESPTLHLIWYDSTIYIKPLPIYLLDWDFSNTHICPTNELHRTACGFLLSYSKLILHQSDFNIAIEVGLLPRSMDWQAWCLLSSNIGQIPVQDVNRRYRYGELRLRRLNQIYKFCKGKMAYHSVYTQYDHFFTQNFAWLLLLFAYLTIVLTAMQVVLATPSVTNLFKDISYWFGVFSILTVAMGVFLMLLLFVLLFTYNMIVTLRYKSKYRRDVSKLGTSYDNQARS